jgi:hypothetical protein
MKSNDVSKCILTSPSDLKNPEVRSSFDNVKGDMKKYYNFY